MITLKIHEPKLSATRG